MLNVVIVMGRLVGNPEFKMISSGEKEIPYVRYRLAVQRDYKRDNGQDVDFIWCKAFGETANFAGKYFKKADMVVVQGRLFAEPYVKPGDNKPSYITGVNVTRNYLAHQYSTELAPNRVMAPDQDCTSHEEYVPADTEAMDIPFPIPDEMDFPPLP